MKKEEIHAILDNMLAIPKSRNFLNHLIRAYFPMSRVDKVWDKPKENFKCVLTKQSLISISEILNGMETEAFRENFLKSIKVALDENAVKVNPFSEIIGDKILGFTGTDTTTFMSYEGLQEFYNWVMTKSLKNDKHINWLLGSIKKTIFLNRAEMSGDKEIQDKAERIKKQEYKESRLATYTLGEVDAFKKLREKFND